MSDEPTMFGGSKDSMPRESRRSLPLSLAIHGVFLFMLFRARSPIFVAPSSVLGGANGTAVTHLYWAAGSSEADSDVSNDTRSRKNSHTGLIWKNSQRTRTSPNRDTHGPETSDEHQVASAAAAPAPSGGSPYGSLSDGTLNGQEIRPALPITTSEPLVSSEDLRGGAEGNVVIEITIDESGNIVNKVVVQSLGSALDGKVLAALENWHFRPATRDGVPIPSKQDVVYHFKPR
jgi:TonB family protein